ncbi:DUF5605 domain-containing protein [Paenibacillus solisilvae]|uniref:DUF5605 domain-containing protein n=1 Tax=Paenibacillus solisilvae TaxID=2486751 RepID=A0ABW0W3M9_9BACL
MSFLSQVLNETPRWAGLKKASQHACAVPDLPLYNDSNYRLYYYGDDEHVYKVEIIDTWNVTIEDTGYHQGTFRIDIPGNEYMAVRIQKRK